MTTLLETVEEKSHTQSLNDSGIYVFMDDVTNESIKPVIEWILYENHIAKVKKSELLLMICSDGGNVEDAFALIDVMRNSTIPVKTVGLGCIASCGLLIFMSGAQGRRILTPNTAILSHQFSWSSVGKKHELFSVTKEFTLTHDRMIRLYEQCTGLSRRVIEQKLLPASDVWLSAEEALKMNICDVISADTSTKQSSTPAGTPEVTPEVKPTRKARK